ncbi:MAG: hypothetical protein IKE10_01115 [Bacilli bacterium]|nr:hypothetical protein [Bacilli bacterium]
MEKVFSDDLKLKVVEKPFITKTGIIYYKTKDNQVAKIFSPKILDAKGEEIEKRVSNPIDLNGVVLPKKIVIDDGKFIGYTMDYVKRMDKESNDKDRLDLYKLADRYLQLEGIVKGAGEDIVFPHLLDTSIIVDKEGKVHITDYEDIQIGDQVTSEIPFILGGMSERLVKYGEHGHYTKQLDMLSLTHYYLRSLFGRFTNRNARALKFFGLDDDMIDRVLCADNDQIDNEYLGEKVLEIADKYELKEIPYDSESTIKKLVLK